MKIPMTLGGYPLDLDSGMQPDEIRVKTDSDGRLIGFVAHPKVTIALSHKFYNPGPSHGK